MMDNDVLEENVKRLIDSAGPELCLPEETKSQILERLCESGARAGTAEQRRSTWRTMAESGIGRLAAAVIIVQLLTEAPVTASTGSICVSMIRRGMIFIASELRLVESRKVISVTRQSSRRTRTVARTVISPCSSS